ncbi:MAG TPA: EAL domain-containing protein [Acidimicrobiales bacterium]|nr:EAL domain-containing protein [Acidimicrobiales bacterium]
MAVTAALGGLSVAGTASLAWRQGTGPLVQVLGLGLALACSQAFPMALMRKGNTEVFNLDEGFLILMFLQLPPVGALVAFAGGILAGNVLCGRAPSRVLYNTAQSLVATALGLVVLNGLDPGHGLVAGRVGAAVAGTAVFNIVNTMAISGIVWLASGVPIMKQLAESRGFRSLVASASAALGILTALASSASAWSLLLAVPPLAMLQVVLGGSLRARRDRERVNGLLRAALDAHASMTVADVESAITDAARSLLRSATARIGAAPSGPDELGRLLPPDGGPERWLVVAGRDERFNDQDGTLLDALIAVAAGALENARLVDQIKHQALHDTLTGLPNQVLFEDRTSFAVAQAERAGQQVGVLFIDLDDFKKVNDGLGHPVGNQLLVQVARRLEQAVRSSDTVARMGGDEFTVLVTAAQGVDDVRSVAEKILEVLQRPFLLDHEELVITPSVGVAVHPEAGRTPSALLKHADTAMYRAKSAGRNNVQVWSPSMAAVAHERLALENDLRAALERGDFTVLYQPQLDMATGAVVAVEALVRWADPDRGVVTPDRFIPLAEETGLVTAIDDWVLRTACQQARRWRDAGLPAIRVAVNLSGRNFADPGLVDRVAAALAEAGIEPELIELEVTEGVAVSGTSAGQLDELRRLGVRLAIDDFGTGYSMLSRLTEFPVQTLKIDRSFLRGVDSSGPASPIVSALVDMAHGLGLTVVAEGVETEEQWAFLAARGCDLAQGYLMCRPAAPEVVEAMLRPAVPAASG